MYLCTIGRCFTQMIAYFLVMNTKRCNVLMQHGLFIINQIKILILYTKSETNIREGKKKVFVEFLSVN